MARTERYTFCYKSVGLGHSKSVVVAIIPTPKYRIDTVITDTLHLERNVFWMICYFSQPFLHDNLAVEGCLVGHFLPRPIASFVIVRHVQLLLHDTSQLVTWCPFFQVLINLVINGIIAGRLARQDVHVDMRHGLTGGPSILHGHVKGRDGGIVHLQHLLDTPYRLPQVRVGRVGQVAHVRHYSVRNDQDVTRYQGS